MQPVEGEEPQPPAKLPPYEPKYTMLKCIAANPENEWREYMYVCVHVYIYECIHVYMYVCMHIDMYECMHDPENE